MPTRITYIALKCYYKHWIQFYSFFTEQKNVLSTVNLKKKNY